MNQQQRDVIDYLEEENRVLREQLGPRRLRFTDAQRRRLASKAQTLGRRVLRGIATIVTPDTLLAWHRTLIAKTYDGRAPEVLAEVVRHSLTKEDIVAVGYRKKQLKVFEKLLGVEEYFEEMRDKTNRTTEGLWQRFFEKNPWIFGYGLQYIYVSGWDAGKLEQVVSGSMVWMANCKFLSISCGAAIVFGCSSVI